MVLVKFHKTLCTKFIPRFCCLLKCVKKLFCLCLALRCVPMTKRGTRKPSKATEDTFPTKFELFVFRFGRQTKPRRELCCEPKTQAFLEMPTIGTGATTKKSQSILGISQGNRQPINRLDKQQKRSNPHNLRNSQVKRTCSVRASNHAFATEAATAFGSSFLRQ